MNGNTMDETLSTAIIIVYSIAVVVCCVAIIAGVWKMFEKAGEGGWKSFIPIYNMYILYKIAWGNGLLFLLLLVPVVDLFMMIVTPFKIAKAYGLSGLYGLGLLLLPVIFFPALGFGRCRYIGPDGKPEGNVYVINQYNYNGVNPETGMPGGQQAGSYHAPAQDENANVNAGSDALEKLGESMQSIKEGVSKLFKNDKPAEQQSMNPAPYPRPAQADPVRSFAAQDSEYRFCTNCGAKIKRTARFCTNCGKEITSPAEIPAAPAFPAAPEATPVPQAPATPVERFDFHDTDSQLDNTVMADTELMDYGEKTEILLDDPITIIPAMTMILEDDQGEKEEIRISETPFVIGRTTANADYAVDARGISRRHLQLDYEDGVYYVTDLNSTNGVYINDNKIPEGERSIVENGDIIGIGQRRYRVEVQHLS